MPIYEYKCPECGYKLEKIVLRRGLASPPLCPKCEKKGKQVKMRRVISRFDIKFVGDDWATNWNKHE